ncbi:MAG: A/G-specific adenine glycosylase [Bacteroidales bacterium]|jgi:A/G-specific adenine glycosylase
MNTIAKKILLWYKKNTRDLPWRNTTDPYHIWISEVILQQTRIEQGTAYYHRFLKTFPSLASLARASEEEVLKQWQGLGYYSRARNLHKAAQQVMANYNGQLPNTYVDLLKLKGVGPYTAGAISSIAFNKPAVAIDGNVYRVLARLFEEDTPINSSTAYKRFSELVRSFLPSSQASAFNQGLIELGALICKPIPNCAQCPLQENCLAFTHNSQHKYPVKHKKKKMTHRYFSFLDIHYGSDTFIERRREGDIWQGLYQFPLLETSTRTTLEKLMQTPQWRTFFPPSGTLKISSSKEFKHQLSHQLLHAKFYHITLSTPSQHLLNKFTQINRAQLADIAIPRLIEKYLLE